jgi:hypothetical protein
MRELPRFGIALVAFLVVAVRGEEVLKLEGHTGVVNAVAVSDDGTYIVSGSADNTVRIWDMETGDQLQMLEGHTDQVSSVAVSGAFIADHGLNPFVISGSSDATVKMWDATTWKEVYSFPHQAEVHSVSVPTEECRDEAAYADTVFPCHGVATASDDGVRIFDPKTGVEKFHLDDFTDIVDAVAFSPWGWEVLTGTRDSKATRWDLVQIQYCEDPQLSQQLDGGEQEEKWCGDAAIRLMNWDQGEHGARLRSTAIWASSEYYYYATTTAAPTTTAAERRLQGYHDVDHNLPPIIADEYGTNTSSASPRITNDVPIFENYYYYFVWGALDFR